MNRIVSVVRNRLVEVLVGSLFLSSIILASCDNRNIHQVVKEMAAAPVDTVGWPGKTMHTNPFSSVDIDCFADVTFHQLPGVDDFYVELKAPAKVLENIDVKVEDGELRIAVDRRYRMPEKAVAVVHIYAPYVNRFVLDGGKCLRLGKINLTSPLEMMVDGNVGTMTADSIVAHEVSLLLDGSGSIDLKGIRTGDVRAKLLGDGRVYLEGECHSTKTTLKGNGKIDLSGLKHDSIVSDDVTGEGRVIRKK